MTQVNRNKIKALFLLRSYKDIAHITPIIWKCSQSGSVCYFMFVDSEPKNDYRINFIKKNGAINIQSKTINFYHRRIRESFSLNSLLKILDLIVSCTLGNYFLRKHSIDVVVTEWSGKTGREKAKYILRAAFINKLRVYSVPHGYNIYTNLDVSKTVIDLKSKTGRWPDFSSRNAFTSYVVQHDSTRKLCEAYGIKKDKLSVLGSARFCREWFMINDKISNSIVNNQLDNTFFKIVFFLPQWDYNVNRKECFRLIVALSEIPGLFIRLKGSTREIANLYDDEESKFFSTDNVVFSKNESSVYLIKWANVVVNFASSIGLEAVMQKKLIINPKYLHSNATIFDNSDVTINCESLDAVTENIMKIKKNLTKIPDSKSYQLFYDEFLEGSDSQENVLEKYVGLILNKK